MQEVKGRLDVTWDIAAHLCLFLEHLYLVCLSNSEQGPFPGKSDLTPGWAYRPHQAFER